MSGVPSWWLTENLYIQDKSEFDTTLLSSEDVSHCIPCSHKVVITRLIQWDEDKLWFAKYVLENAPVLDQLTISLFIKANVELNIVIKGELHYKNLSD